MLAIHFGVIDDLHPDRPEIVLDDEFFRFTTEGDSFHAWSEDDQDGSLHVIYTTRSTVQELFEFQQQNDYDNVIDLLFARLSRMLEGTPYRLADYCVITDYYDWSQDVLIGLRNGYLPYTVASLNMPAWQAGHAVIWPLPGADEETQVRLFTTDEEAVEWAATHCPRGSWQYAAVVEPLERSEA